MQKVAPYGTTFCKYDKGENDELFEIRSHLAADDFVMLLYLILRIL